MAVKIGRSGLPSFVVSLSVLVVLIIYTLTLLSYSRLMGFNDYFGQMSLDPYAFPLFSVLTALSFTLIYLTRKNKSVIFLTIPLIAFILARFYLPWFSFPQYGSEFYDAPGFLARTEYVLYTGHTTPIYPLDQIVRQQPGFEWANAMLIDIMNGIPTSPTAFILSFLVKYYNVIEVLVYTPIVLYVFRKLGLDIYKSFIGLIIFFGFEFSPNLHYVDQTYATPLYWLLLLLVYLSVKEGGLKHSVPIAVLSSGIMLSHLGVAFFSFFGLLALAIYYLRKNRKPLYYTVLFGIGWITYLNYIALLYDYYVGLGYDMATSFMNISSAIHVVSQDLYRPLPIWAEIVFYQAIYMAIITLTPALLFFLLSRKSDKKEEYLMLAVLILITSLIVGPVAAKLGGAGYITRIPQQLMPFMAIAFAEMSFSRKLKPLFATVVIILVLIGSLYYYEGRNFEAVLNNDNVEFFYNYAVSKPPSFLLMAYYPPRFNATLTGYSIPQLIWYYYYEYGNFSIIQEIVYNTSLRNGIIYMAPGFVIGIN
ncbi:MAG: hypothetical protein L7H13_08130 [Sulfolobales archaeon]|nr:hypothetical protein [Sulfolobales archaeon]